MKKLRRNFNRETYYDLVKQCYYNQCTCAGCGKLYETNEQGVPLDDENNPITECTEARTNRGSHIGHLSNLNQANTILYFAETTNEQ